MTQPAIFDGPRRDDWRTPAWLRDLIKDQYEIFWDLAACRESSLGYNNYSAEQSFLEGDGIGWANIAWLNPPFSLAEKFFERVADTMRCAPSTRLLAIYKANLETETWQKHILPTCSWVFAPRGRIAYDEPVSGGVKKSSPQFASLLIGWNVPPPKGVPGTLLITKGQQ